MKYLSLVLMLAGAQAFAAGDPVQMGRDLTDTFYAKDIASVWGRMTPQMREALGGENALAAFRDQVAGQIGNEVAVISEDVQEMHGARVYIRVARFSNLNDPIVVTWAFDGEDRVAGFHIRPQQKLAESQYIDYDTKADLRLPFDGEWFVFWGGRTLTENYHAAHANQRFAYDLVVTKQSSTHTGDGKAKEDYYCWGKEILAPADGLVVVVVSDLPDNEPGKMDPKNPPGNHVVIDLGNDEFALLAHLQQDSVSVAEGDIVEAGQALGRCGNSGNTTEPHLHFHIQDKKVFGQGDSKPAFFNHYLADGSRVERGEPTRGQVVVNSP